MPHISDDESSVIQFALYSALDNYRQAREAIIEHTDLPAETKRRLTAQFDSQIASATAVLERLESL